MLCPGQEVATLLWKINAKSVKSSAQIDYNGPVETQSGNGRSTGRCDSKNMCCIIAPDHMLCPPLKSWVKKSDFIFSHRIYPCQENSRKRIATKA